MKKIISLLLVLVMLSLSLISCEIIEESIQKEMEKVSNKIDEVIYGYDDIVASSDNFEITFSMMSYFWHYYFNIWYGNNYDDILSGCIEFDVMKPLSEQYVDQSNTQTYYDYFLLGAKDMVIEYLKCCEAALDDSEINYEEFEAKVQKTTDEQMFIVKKQLVFTNASLDTYISQYYGKYVNEKNLYKALIIENSVKYYCEIMYQRIKDDSGVDDEALAIKKYEEWLDSLSYSVSFDDSRSFEYFGE